MSATGVLGAALRPSTRRVPGPVQAVTAVVVGLALVALVASAARGARVPRPPHHPAINLYLDGLARDATGSVVAVPAWAGVTYLPGTRVIDPSALDLAAADRAWLASGIVPGAGGPYEDMVAGALLDLRALTGANGAMIAAPYRIWAYVWPRDASFGAAALAVTGHTDDALAVLLHLQDLQGGDGSFQARYLPDGTGRVPDGRLPQSDGAGWALWATMVLLAALAEPERAEAAARLTRLTDRSAAFIRRQIATPTGLPLASSDYWEVRPRRLTLGTAAPLLAGLEAARTVYEMSGRGAEALGAATAAGRLRAAVAGAFGPAGYPRELGRRLPDAATAFLLPPFQPAPLDGAEAAWRGSVPGMLRPAGGLAPGAGWRDDGISWTPQTSLYALTAATLGDRRTAEAWLDWLDGHRTASGALPEKVLADGTPAAVAPLAWTCALVVLAVHALDER